MMSMPVPFRPRPPPRLLWELHGCLFPGWGASDGGGRGALLCAPDRPQAAARQRRRGVTGGDGHHHPHAAPQPARGGAQELLQRRHAPWLHRRRDTHLSWMLQRWMLHAHTCSASSHICTRAFFLLLICRFALLSSQGFNLPAHQHLFPSFDRPTWPGIFYSLTFNPLTPSFNACGLVHVFAWRGRERAAVARRCLGGVKKAHSDVGKVEKHKVVTVGSCR